MQKKKRVLIAAGGTGGHILPAVVFGRWLEARHEASVSYLAGGRPPEGEIYAYFGIEPQILPIEGSPLGVRSPVRMLLRSLALLKSLGTAARCISLERPDVCVLFGGYVSLPPLLVCRIRRIPVVIHEQNAVAGRVTRLASRWGAVVASGWRVCDGVPSFLPVGIPVRRPERLSPSRAGERMALELPKEGRIVGVAGGSLGSRELVERALAAAAFFEKNGDDVVFLFLGEPPEFDLPSNVRFVGRQWDMNPFYSLCDVLICRAGGSTLAEALRWGIPTVVVPWEGAAEGHQERNARCFEEAGGGVVWREGGGEPLESPLRKLFERGRGAADGAPDACPALRALLPLS